MESCASLHIPRGELVVFSKIQKVVPRILKIKLVKDQPGKTCHLIVRVLNKFFPVEYRDGFFGERKHSWLVTKTNNLIEPYLIDAIGGPIFIVIVPASPWLSLYKECILPELGDVRFLADVVKITEEVRQIMSSLGFTANL